MTHLKIKEEVRKFVKGFESKIWIKVIFLKLRKFKTFKF